MIITKRTMGVSSCVGFGGAQVAPKWRPSGPKWRQRGTKWRPSGAQGAPKGRQVAPKGRPRGAYVAPKWSPRGAKWRPSGTQVATPECPETQVFLPTPTTGRPTPKGGPGSLTPHTNPV